MADTYLTQMQIEDIFQSLTSTILNTTDPSAVRINWPLDGSPFQTIDQDICYLAISSTDNQQSRQFYHEYDELDPQTASSSVTYIDAFRVMWTIYGPGSSDNADMIRANLNTEQTTSTLEASGIALITDISMPLRQPELFNGQWWPRTSFYANFTQLVKRESTTPYLATADIQIEEG